MTKTLLSIAFAASALLASANTTVSVAPANKNELAKFPTERRVNLTDSKFDFVQAPAGISEANPAKAPKSRAGESMEWKLYDELAGALGLPSQQEGSEVKMAVEFDEASTNKFAGAQISALSLYTGTNGSKLRPQNAVTSVTVFFTYDLDGEPFYTQEATLGKTQYNLETVTLDKPLTIEAGKPFYFGYSYLNTKATLNAYTLTLDGIPTDNPAASLVYYTYQGESGWDSLADSYGAFCISLTLTGKLPQNYLSLAGMAVPSTVTAGQPFEAVILVGNTGANAIQNFTVQTTIGETTTSATFDTSSLDFGFNTYVRGTLSNLVCNTTGVNIPIKFEITQVNGVPNNETDNNASNVFNSLNAGTGFDRNVIVEEGTGTWCGWCPIGYTAIEKLSEVYTDGTLIPVAVHAGDEMMAQSYLPMIDTYFNSFPNFICNRDFNYQSGFANTLDQNMQMFSAIYNEIRATKSVASLAVSAEYTDANETSLSVSADAKFALGYNTADYLLAYALVENNVGPYTQHNYLSGSQGYTGYENFMNGKDEMSLVYNDVARNIWDAFGIEGSLPATVEANKNYNHTYTIPLKGIKDYNATRLVAMMINQKTGVIENVVATKLPYSSGIEAVLNNALTPLAISGEQGAVVINGNYTTANVYTTAGVLVATAHGESTITLPAGLYVVKADAQVAKVSVR